MQRQRLTITLKKDLLSQIDKKIDGVKIRNRSHAIEYILSNSLSQKISKALILSGGKGIKMRPFTYEMPKSMIPVHGRPILEYIINLLRENNIRDIYIGVDYLSDKIKNYFSDGSKFGVRIKYLESKFPLGTGGTLKLAKPYLSSDNFLLIHGDVLAKIDMQDLIDFSFEEKNIVTMALTTSDDPCLYGAVKLRGSKIIDFSEKSKTSINSPKLVNAGIYVFKSDIFSYLPNTKKFNLEEKVLPKLIKDKIFIGYHFSGKWYDISTPKSYELALKEWK